MIEKIARWTIYAGAFAVLCIPFLVTTSMYFPYITGKNFAFRIIVELMLGAWAVLMLLNRTYRPKRSAIFLAMVLFVVVIGIADMFGAQPLRSFWSNFERMEGFIAILHLAAYLFVVGSVIRGEKIWNVLLNVSVGISTILSLQSFSELSSPTGALVRVDATLGNPTYFAVYLLFNIFIALVLLYRRRENKLWAGAYAVAAVFQVIALYNTGTRGTLLGLIGGLILAALIIVLRGAAYPRLRRVAGISLAVAVIGGGLFIALRHTSFVQSSPILARVANISVTDTTVQSRIILWSRIGWSGFKERPLLGWGQDNFIVVFGKYYDPEMYKQEPWFDRAHNVFVDWLIAGGALGLLAYLLLFGAGVYVLWKSDSFPLPEKALLFGLLAAYFFHNIFVFDNLISYIYFTLFLAYLHARSLSPHESPKSVAVENVREGLPIVLGGAVVITIALMYFANVPYIARAQNLIDALSADYGKKYDSVLPAYDRVLSNGGVGLEEAKEQLSQSAIRLWGTDAPTDVKQAMALRARAELEKSVAHDPENTRPLFFLAYLVSRTMSAEEGITLFQKALAINPARQNFLYELGQIYLMTGKSDEAIATFKEAYEFAPENEQALGYYAAALINSGAIEAGEKLLLESVGTTTLDNEVLFSAYANQKQYRNLAAILNARLAAMAPQDDAETRVRLALIYLEMGDRPAAIAEIERAMELDAKFAPQGTQMIEAIKAGKTIRIQ
jgi:O-antigen ligase/Tfp pilus assembly protein PilF